MNMEDLLKEELSLRLWNQYFRRMERLTRLMDPKSREEIHREIKAHLLESMTEIELDNETERLLEAMERLGEPESFLHPMMADRYLKRATRTLSPGAVARGLYFTIRRGIRWASVSFLFVFGYVLFLLCCVMAVFKPIFPNHVGVFMTFSGGPVIGLLGNSADIKTDVLGYWIIPLSLFVGAVLYVGLTKLLRVLRKSPPHAG